jgi:hypothetical protein
MKPALALAGGALAATVIVLLVAGSDITSGASTGSFRISTDPAQIVLTMRMREMVHPPGARRYEVFGDGWIQRHDAEPESRLRTSAGLLLDRAEVAAAVSDLVDFGVLEADLRQLAETIEPKSGVLPDGRRWVQGSAEPGTGWVVTVKFEEVSVRSEPKSNYTLKFSLEPFLRGRSKHPEIRELEGISRFAEKVGRWMGALDSRADAAQ